MSGPLVCPSCATTHALEARFCPKCNMPLVYAGSLGVDQPVTERHERARKVKRQYSEGELVRAASARNQAEAELIQGMLLEEGIPSLAQRMGGFDVPDFLAAGPRVILVPQSGLDAARDVLLTAEEPEPPDADEPARASATAAAASAASGYSPSRSRFWRIVAALMAALLLLGAILVVIQQIAG